MSPLQLTTLVAKRELTEQLRSKTFQVITLALVVAVAGVILVPAAIGGGEQVQTVGVVGGSPPGLEQATVVAGKVARLDDVLVRQIPSEADARRELVDGDVDVVVLNRQVILLKKEPTTGVESPSTALAEALSQLIGINRAFAAMPQSDEKQITENLRLPIRGVEPPGSELESRIAGTAAVLVIYMFILVNGMRITQSVAEEKSTRVIEVLLSGVRPLQLLVGKVLGLGAAAALQLLAMLATFLIGGLIVGDDFIRGDAGRVVLAGAIWLVLGYALYCTLFAAAGALISRQSDASSVSFPLLLPLILAFGISVSVLFGEAGTIFTVLAYFPFTAPIAMPTLYAIGEASAAEFTVSALLSMVTIYFAFRISATVFERAILRTGARVNVTQVLRADPM